MLESQRKLLSTMCRDYMSIGITEDGQPRRCIPIPWEQTATAYNMRLPKIYLEPSDLEDETLMAHLETFRVRGMYIFTPLEDYSFVGRFRGLWDVYICRGGGWIDISFMRQLPEWSMFYLCDAIIPDISPVFTTRREQILKHRKICMTNYRIDTPEDDGEGTFFIAELLME